MPLSGFKESYHIPSKGVPHDDKTCNLGYGMFVLHSKKQKGVRIIDKHPLQKVVWLVDGQLKKLMTLRVGLRIGKHRTIPIW